MSSFVRRIETGGNVILDIPVGELTTHLVFQLLTVKVKMLLKWSL
jgi:hypothetical protein